MKHKMLDIVSHRWALYHMMGQLEDMGCYELSTREIAKIMGVTLPTAIKRLNAMADSRAIRKNVVKHRRNADAYKWSLSLSTRKRYDNNHFYTYYLSWRSEAFGE